VNMIIIFRLFCLWGARIFQYVLGEMMQCLLKNVGLHMIWQIVLKFSQPAKKSLKTIQTIQI